MKLLIDGYNLLNKVEVKGDSLEEKREKFIFLISEFCGVNKTGVTIVFDGAGQESVHRGYEKRGKVKLVFSAKGETADDVIMETVDIKKNAKDLLIVTSDRKIRDFAAARGASLQTAEEFSQYLE